VNRVPDDTAGFQTWNLPGGRLNFLLLLLFSFFFRFAIGGGVTWTELGLG
jgi:hypothetical protein